MAGIDKTYANWEQYQEIKNFFTPPQMIKKQTKDLGYYFGYFDEYDEKDFKTNTELVIWNTPYEVDLWLAKNCKIYFVQKRLKQQYPLDWVGFKNKVGNN